MNSLLQRISVDPKVCFGKPCVKGTRIWLALTSGTSAEEILAHYPQLEKEDIDACLAYDAASSK